MAEPLLASHIVADMDTYLGLGDSLNATRAQLVAELALVRAEAVIKPVPLAARSILLDVAVRAYSNPVGASQEQVGPFSRTFHGAGVYLTDKERADLAVTAGVTGAFTITPGPRPAG